MEFDTKVGHEPYLRVMLYVIHSNHAAKMRNCDDTSDKIAVAVHDMNVSNFVTKVK